MYSEKKLSFNKPFIQPELNLSICLFIILTLVVFIIAGCRKDDESARLKLFTADKEWSAAIADGNVDKIVSFWSEDAILYFPEAPIVIGRESIKGVLRKNRAIPGFTLEHNPAEVFVSSSNDLGYTTGTFNISLPNKEGKLLKRQGNYVCIWNKQKDGSWKCSVNIGNYRSSIVKEVE